MSPAQRRRSDWHVLAGSLLAILCVAGMSLWIHGQGDDLSALGKKIGSAFFAQVQACQRLQILRVEDNVSHYADYKVFKIVLVQSESAVNRAAESPLQRRFERVFLPELRQAVAAKQWVPLTDCVHAVSLYGARYRPPAPVSFTKRLPPRSALEIPPSVYR